MGVSEPPQSESSVAFISCKKMDQVDSKDGRVHPKVVAFIKNLKLVEFSKKNKLFIERKFCLFCNFNKSIIDETFPRPSFFLSPKNLISASFHFILGCGKASSELINRQFFHHKGAEHVLELLLSEFLGER